MAQNEKMEWTITDPDCLQCCRETPDHGPGVFELVQINEFGAEWTGSAVYQVAHGFIYLSDYSKEENLEILATYGYDVRPGAEENHFDLDDESFDQYLAEMHFESEQREMSCRNCTTWNEAVSHIETLTGLDLNLYKEKSQPEKQDSLDAIISDAEKRTSRAPAKGSMHKEMEF